MSKKGKGNRLILCNDGGPLAGPTLEAPIGEEGLSRLVIDPLIGTGVDTLYWQIGTDPYRGTPANRHTDIYSHRTDVAPRWGDETDIFETAGDWRIYENTRQLIENDTDPPEVVINHGHKVGLEVFLSMRVNDVHDGKLPGDLPKHLSPVKKKHPDWLLGQASKKTIEHDQIYGPLKGLTRFAYDFSNPEVRNYKLNLTKETIENYDLDGLDWDFCRFPRLFPEGDTVQYAEILTDMLREIKKSLDEKSRRIGRKLLFSVRVPPTFSLAGAFGMDVKTWIDEELIDILIAGVVEGSMFRVPIEDYVSATRDTNIKAIAQNLGLFWTGRPLSAKVIYEEPTVFTNEMCRASASNYWQAGADGIYLWNNQLIQFNFSAKYDGQPWREIWDPQIMAKLDKHYLIDNKPLWEIYTLEMGSSPIPRPPLPIDLKVAGDTADINIDIADNVPASNSDGSLLEATLRIMIINLTDLDKLDFKLNGNVLDITAAQIRILYNDCWIEFDVSNMEVHQGCNRIEISVKQRNTHVDAALTIESVEAIIRYVN